MSFNQQMIEEIAAWCVASPELASGREEARQRFFAADDPRPMKYWPGAETRTSRARRFSGYFMFDHVLPNAEKPGEVAVKHLYSGTLQVEALKAVRGAQFVLAVVSSIIGRSVYLEIETDSFEVRSPVWAAQLRIGQAVVAHLVPVRHGYWLPGPGWLLWPIGLGPGIRSSLKSFQFNPVSLERFLQGRMEEGDEGPRPAPPSDGTLEEAVARMTEAAAREDHEGLVMSVGRWKALVWKHLDSQDVGSFGQEIIKRLGDVKDLEDLQRWLDLAVNIWNNTPQPDRGGKSANELANQWRDASGSNAKT